MTSPEFEGLGKIRRLTQRSVEPIFLQTADPFVYRDMLNITSATVIAYCRRHELRYESYIGIKRGVWPWHAAYNRLFMLKELMDRGFRGWAVYLDADAFIADQSFDLRAYLADKADYALIGVFALGNLDPSIPGNGPHNINNGVILVNLGHPMGRAVVEEWHQRYLDIPEYIVRQAEVFDVGMPSDQELLYKILEGNAHYVRHLHHERLDLINSSYASFIRQHLRAMYTTYDERVRAISAEVDDILMKQAGGGVADGPESPRENRRSHDPAVAIA